MAQGRSLEGEVRRDDDAAEVSCVPPNLTKGVRSRGATGTDAGRVFVIDVQSGRAVELVVECIECIGTQSQGQTLVEFESLLNAQVHLVTGLGASHVAADSAGKGIAST